MNNVKGQSSADWLCNYVCESVVRESTTSGKLNFVEMQGRLGFQRRHDVSDVLLIESMVTACGAFDVLPVQTSAVPCER